MIDVESPKTQTEQPAAESAPTEGTVAGESQVQFSDGGELPAVQMATPSGATPPSASDQAYGVHAVAEHGVRGASAALPHRDKIAASFGAHAPVVNDIGARVGGRAADAARALGGAKAYATASQVAFENEPDLHTAAHEAAHVVQQRGGVELPGGVGKAGDRHERTADAVADRVVAGKPAGDLLGPLAKAPVTNTGVQGLHGDLGTELRPELGGDGQRTVAEALAEKDKTSGIKRDKNANNARKVEFEGQLAAAILRNPHTYAGPVHQTSRNILSYLRRREAQLKISLRDSLMQLGGQSNFFGRLMDDITGTNEPLFLAEIQNTLGGAGNIPNHMLIHHQFWTKIYEEQDFAQSKAQELLEGVAQHPAFVRHKTKIDVDGAQVNPFDKDQRGRDASVNKANATAGRAEQEFGQNKVEPVGAASGFSERESTAHAEQGGTAKAVSQPTTETEAEGDREAGLAQSHTRGVDMWTVNESKAFTQKARVLLDMPIAAGVSGTTADLMGCAEVIGGVTSKEAKMQYGLAVLGFLGSAGAHSFHEILTVVGAAGGSYEEGNYRGVYPAAFEATPEFARLRAQYPEFLGGADDEQQQDDEANRDEEPAPRQAVV